MGIPLAELTIDAVKVRELLFHQHSDLAELSLLAVSSVWDNAIFRLGEHLAVRLPRREVAAALVLNEQRWLPRLAAQLPLKVPVPGGRAARLVPLGLEYRAVDRRRDRGCRSARTRGDLLRTRGQTDGSMRRHRYEGHRDLERGPCRAGVYGVDLDSRRRASAQCPVRARAHRGHHRLGRYRAG
jgi:hypothetical protein